MHVTDAIRALDRDLRDIFGARLESVVAYRGHANGGAARTLAVVSSLSAADLRACAAKVAAWREQDALYLPDFPPSAVADLRETLDYPPRGSAQRGHLPNRS